MNDIKNLLNDSKDLFFSLSLEKSTKDIYKKIGELNVGTLSLKDDISVKFDIDIDYFSKKISEIFNHSIANINQFELDKTDEEIFLVLLSLDKLSLINPRLFIKTNFINLLYSVFNILKKENISNTKYLNSFLTFLNSVLSKNRSGRNRARLFNLIIETQMYIDLNSNTFKSFELISDTTIYNEALQDKEYQNRLAILLFFNRILKKETNKEKIEELEKLVLSSLKVEGFLHEDITNFLFEDNDFSNLLSYFDSFEVDFFLYSLAQFEEPRLSSFPLYKQFYSICLNHVATYSQEKFNNFLLRKYDNKKTDLDQLLKKYLPTEHLNKSFFKKLFVFTLNLENLPRSNKRTYNTDYLYMYFLENSEFKNVVNEFISVLSSKKLSYNELKKYSSFLKNISEKSDILGIHINKMFSLDLNSTSFEELCLYDLEKDLLRFLTDNSKKELIEFIISHLYSIPSKDIDFSLASFLRDNLDSSGIDIKERFKVKKYLFKNYISKRENNEYNYFENLYSFEDKEYILNNKKKVDDNFILDFYKDIIKTNFYVDISIELFYNLFNKINDKKKFLKYHFSETHTFSHFKEIKNVNDLDLIINIFNYIEDNDLSLELKTHIIEQLEHTKNFSSEIINNGDFNYIDDKYFEIFPFLKKNIKESYQNHVNENIFKDFLSNSFSIYINDSYSNYDNNKKEFINKYSKYIPENTNIIHNETSNDKWISFNDYSLDVSNNEEVLLKIFNKYKNFFLQLENKYFFKKPNSNFFSYLYSNISNREELDLFIEEKFNFDNFDSSFIEIIFSYVEGHYGDNKPFRFLLQNIFNIITKKHDISKFIKFFLEKNFLEEDFLISCNFLKNISLRDRENTLFIIEYFSQYFKYLEKYSTLLENNKENVPEKPYYDFILDTLSFFEVNKIEYPDYILDSKNELFQSNLKRNISYYEKIILSEIQHKNIKQKLLNDFINSFLEKNNISQLYIDIQNIYRSGYFSIKDILNIIQKNNLLLKDTNIYEQFFLNKDFFDIFSSLDLKDEDFLFLNELKSLSSPILYSKIKEEGLNNVLSYSSCNDLLEMLKVQFGINYSHKERYNNINQINERQTPFSLKVFKTSTLYTSYDSIYRNRGRYSWNVNNTPLGEASEDKNVNRLNKYVQDYFEFNSSDLNKKRYKVFSNFFFYDNGERNFDKKQFDVLLDSTLQFFKGFRDSIKREGEDFQAILLLTDFIHPKVLEYLNENNISLKFDRSKKDLTIGGYFNNQKISKKLENSFYKLLDLKEPFENIYVKQINSNTLIYSLEKDISSLETLLEKITQNKVKHTPQIEYLIKRAELLKEAKFSDFLYENPLQREKFFEYIEDVLTSIIKDNDKVKELPLETKFIVKVYKGLKEFHKPNKELQNIMLNKIFKNQTSFENLSLESFQLLSLVILDFDSLFEFNFDLDSFSKYCFVADADIREHQEGFFINPLFLSNFSESNQKFIKYFNENNREHSVSNEFFKQMSSFLPNQKINFFESFIQLAKKTNNKNNISLINNFYYFVQRYNFDVIFEKNEEIFDLLFKNLPEENETFYDFSHLLKIYTKEEILEKIIYFNNYFFEKKDFVKQRIILDTFNNFYFSEDFSDNYEYLKGLKLFPIQAHSITGIENSIFNKNKETKENVILSNDYLRSSFVDFIDFDFFEKTQLYIYFNKVGKVSELFKKITTPDLFLKYGEKNTEELNELNNTIKKLIKVRKKAAEFKAIASKTKSEAKKEEYTEKLETLEIERIEEDIKSVENKFHNIWASWYKDINVKLSIFNSAIISSVSNFIIKNENKKHKFDYIDEKLFDFELFEKLYLLLEKDRKDWKYEDYALAINSNSKSSFLLSLLNGVDVKNEFLHEYFENCSLVLSEDNFNKIKSFDYKKYLKTKRKAADWFSFNLDIDMVGSVSYEMLEKILFLTNYDLNRIKVFSDFIKRFDLSLDDFHFLNFNLIEEFGERDYFKFAEKIISYLNNIEENFIPRGNPKLFEILNSIDFVNETLEGLNYNGSILYNTYKLKALNNNIENIQMSIDLTHSVKSTTNNNGEIHISNTAERAFNKINDTLEQFILVEDKNKDIPKDNDKKVFKFDNFFYFKRLFKTKSGKYAMQEDIPPFDTRSFSQGYATASCLTPDGLAKTILFDMAEHPEKWDTLLISIEASKIPQKIIKTLEEKIEEFNEKLLEGVFDIKLSEEIKKINQNYFFTSGASACSKIETQRIYDNMEVDLKTYITDEEGNQMRINKTEDYIIEAISLSSSLDILYSELSYLEELKSYFIENGSVENFNFYKDRQLYHTIGSGYSDITLDTFKKIINKKHLHTLKGSGIYTDADIDQQYLVNKHPKYTPGDISGFMNYITGFDTLEKINKRIESLKKSILEQSIYKTQHKEVKHINLK